jgi:hypothetical protein
MSKVASTLLLFVNEVAKSIVMALQVTTGGASSSTAAVGGNMTFLAEDALNLLQISTVDKQGLQQDVDHFLGQVRTKASKVD